MAVTRGLAKVPWSAGEAIQVFVLSWVGLPLLALFGLHQLAGVLPAAHQFLQALSDGQLAAGFEFDLLTAAAALIWVAWRLRRHGVGWPAVGLRRFHPLQALGYLLAIYLVFIIGVSALFTLVSVLFPHFNPDQAQVNQFTQAAGTSNLSFAALVLIPPFMEEVVFRGFVFPGLARRFGIIGGAVITSLLFGLAHLQANISLYTFLLSLLLCFLYVRLRSIWPGIAFHMINNYLAFIAIGTAK